MKRIAIFFAAMTLTFTAAAQKPNQTYLTYIEQWKATALQNQADYGIPASIIMAQALLESAAGTSELAVNANNHFGIKCTSEWFGAVYYYDDDSEGECFRQYSDAAESFKDHALFLQRPRYAICFEIAVEDYEGWAHRLKACGYATDKNYAPKLIKLIEDYKLNELNDAPAELNDAPAEPNDAATEPKAKTPNQTANSPKQTANSHKPLKAEVVHGTTPIAVITRDPEPPYEEPLSARDEKKLFLLQHPQKKCNGVSYVEAREGDTYANIAFRLNVRERSLREWNDALGRELNRGDRVYMSAKKKKVPQEKSLMWVHPGEALWDICQREGIQIAQVRKLNGFAPELRVFRTRQQIYLNKVKGER
ncbi:MAG: glucosaminidase domain-containing protein [Paludibacteraceae bacterium]|nr:glucosaminidase domain-containing protein [Paludibacteraceae bacterium]